MALGTSEAASSAGTAAEPQSFADLLREFRTRAHLSQEALATAASLSVKTVASLEQGLRRAPYRRTVEAIADALGLSTDDKAMLVRASTAARPPRPTRACGEGIDRAVATPATSFIARPEVARLAELVRSTRLVTVTGPGGVGKTRTAIEAVTHGARAVRPTHFVDLSLIRDGAVVAATIAAALHVEVSPCGITPAGLASALAGGPVFALLDGCERVVDAVADVVGELLRLTDTVSILATSREPLGLSNESIFRLPSFAVPATAAELHTAGVRFPAIDLFIERAGLAAPGARLTEEELATIVGLCRRLDGVPLAIELAAAHLATFGLDVLRERLLEALAIPGPRDAPARQQTMLTTIAWSFELLDPAEQRLLERLAIFHGGFTLDAMAAVCADGAQTRGDISSVLFRLIDKSLVEVMHGGSTTRYRLLELVRDYALERLSRSEEDQTVAHRHVHWMASAADALRNDPTCRDFSGANSDLENARAAVEFAFGVGTEDGCILGGRILLGFRPIWYAVGDYNEYIALAQRCLGRLDPREAWQQAAELMHALAESETEACFASVAEVMLNVAPRPPLRLVE